MNEHEHEPGVEAEVQTESEPTETEKELEQEEPEPADILIELLADMRDTLDEIGDKIGIDTDESGDGDGEQSDETAEGEAPQRGEHESDGASDENVGVESGISVQEHTPDRKPPSGHWYYRKRFGGGT